MEFGVASGRTIRAIAEETGRQVYDFDSFQGLPEDWRDGAPAGAFASQIPNVPGNVSLRIGMIEQELPKLLEEDKQEIRFTHVDTDLYAVAKFVLDTCASRMNDTIIAFDEFYNYPGWRDHEYKAWTEFQEAHADVFEIEYVALGGEVALSARVRRKQPAG